MVNIVFLRIGYKEIQSVAIHVYLNLPVPVPLQTVPGKLVLYFFLKKKEKQFYVQSPLSNISAG